MRAIRKLKDNRVMMLSILGGGILLILMAFTFLNQSSKLKELETTHAELLNELSKVERDIGEKQAELDKKKAASVRELTGLDPSLVSSDEVEAKEYFKPAFDWKNGDEYEQARQDYIKSLGADNSFTKVYLPPDTKIETDDGELSYIDFKKIKATMDDIYIIPMTAEGNRVRYVAFVRYFMHKDNKDLANTDALVASQAIVEFTASGDAETGGRKVSEVIGRAGFSSSEDSE